ESDGCDWKERAADDEASDAGNRRVETERAPHVPRGRCAEVVVAGKALRRRLVYLKHDAAHCFLRAPGRACKCVCVRRDETRLVADVEEGLAPADEFGEELVEPARHFRIAADRREEAAIVVRDHPGVLPSVPLLEPRLRALVPGDFAVRRERVWVEAFEENAACASRSDKTCLRVEELLPVLRASHEDGTRTRVAERGGQTRDAEVVRHVFETSG